jgi:hypothetical protein
MRRLLVFTAAFFLCGSATAGLDAFTALVEGRYDNELQVFFEKDQAKPGAPLRERRHIAIRKTAEGVYAVTSATDERLKDAVESRIWRVTQIDSGISMTVDLAAGLSSGCVVQWVPEGEGFKTVAAPGCPGDAARVLRLTRDGLEASGRDPGQAPHQLKRVRPFECWVAVLRGAKHGDSGKGAKDTDWFFQRGVWIHDQGGLATVATDETPARALRLRLRRVAWPSGPNRPSLTLYVLPDGDDRAVSYAWGEFDAGRLGLNLRWMQASCTHAPDKMWP